MATCRLLPEDKAWLESRLSELEQKIKDLGPEFHEVLNQSSETWHDNAPFDAVRDKQSLLYAEYSHLKFILLNSHKVSAHSSNSVAIGSHIEMTSGGKTRRYYVAGDWTHMTGRQNGSGATVVTAKSPLGEAVIGAKLNQETKFGVVSLIE